MEKIVKSIRGTLSVAIDTNFNFRDNFQAKYKDVDFVYHWGEKDNVDCIVSCIIEDIKKTYFLVTEFISLLSYTLDIPFFIRESASDGFCGNLIERKPGCSATRMMKQNIDMPGFCKGFPPIKCLPQIDTNKKSNLARLYRMARALEQINPISSFLFYFHILDFPKENDSQGIAINYINQFFHENKDTNIADIINSIEKNRIFEKNSLNNSVNNKETKKYDGSLGDYIKKKVRDSVGHIVRHESTGANDLVIDSFEQNKHFVSLNYLMRQIARDKLDHLHSFNIDGYNKNLILIKSKSVF